MKDKSNLHQKVQELCDCFATAEPLSEMFHLRKEADGEEGALKWIALAVLHGINDNAKKISITKSEDGRIEANAKYRKSELPSPGAELGDKILKAIKEIIHLEEDKGKSPLALGIGDSSLELKIKVKGKDGSETVTIEFPE